MKTTILTVSALALMTGIATAETGFQHGVIDVDGYGFGVVSGMYAFNLTARGAFDLGTVGLQTDARAAIVTDFTDHDEIYSVGAHAYGTLAAGHRVGGYLAYSYAGDSGADYVFGGGEGMFELGNMDVEASLGVLHVTSGGTSRDFADVGLAAYFDVAPNVEIMAAYKGYHPLGTGGASSLNAGLVKATYNFVGTPWEANATVGYTDSRETVVYGLGFSYTFGPEPAQRMFTTHDLNFAHIGGGS